MVLQDCDGLRVHGLGHLGLRVLDPSASVFWVVPHLQKAVPYKVQDMLCPHSSTLHSKCRRLAPAGLQVQCPDSFPNL